MNGLKLVQRVVVLGIVLGKPILASAANIIVTPTSQGAPLISLPLLMVLALLALAAGVRSLRAGSALGRVGGVALLIGALALTAHAGRSVIVLDGDTCGERTEIKYESEESVRNDCPNSMTIISVDPDCTPGLQGNSLLNGDPVICAAGVVLASGATCELPGCET